MDAKSRQALLAVAHDALQTYFINEQKEPPDTKLYPDLGKKSGAFVSLYVEGELRGCVGHITADRPLIEIVRQMAISAATQDFRFPSITPEELSRVTIEISVISEMQPMQDVHSIQIGVHGLFIKSGAMQGLLLPQVASRYEWSAEDFLAQTCRKAQLPEDAHTWDETEVSTFTAEIIKEEPAHS
jgi:AmmeMemoRadiSam system protein A